MKENSLDILGVIEQLIYCCKNPILDVFSEVSTYDGFGKRNKPFLSGNASGGYRCAEDGLKRDHLVTLTGHAKYEIFIKSFTSVEPGAVCIPQQWAGCGCQHV